MPEDILGKPGLDNAPGIHHVNPLRVAGDYPQVMRHDNQRSIQPRHQVFHQLQQLCLCRHIYGRRRLIGKDNHRIAGYCHRYHHPLPHPAAELMGIIIYPSGGIRYAYHF